MRRRRRTRTHALWHFTLPLGHRLCELASRGGGAIARKESAEWALTAPLQRNAGHKTKTVGLCVKG